jgi:hypothetical protein
MTISRQWHAEEAKRSHTPLLVGLMGPAGSGKTFSALRLASGIQHIVGGDIYGIDTESRRMLHYAEDFKFKHVDFKAPFSSAAYEECLKWCVSQGAKTIIVDSFSHEHSSEGGYLDYHEKELERLAGENASQAERDKRNMQAWIRPSQARQKLINSIIQLDANFVFTFRARERVKPMGNGKIQELGFVPISGDEMLFELTVCCLLMPAANGVPTWKSAMPGESLMIKPAKQFEDLFDSWGINRQRPLDEKHGEGLARWARGDTARPLDSASSAGSQSAPEATSSASGAGTDAGSTGTGEPTSALPADWDHMSWAKGFEENMPKITTVADLDAVRKRVLAISNARRKVLADREKASADF